VAGAALEAGATIVNDVSAFRGDPDLAAVCAERKAVVVLMHAGDPLHVVPETTGDPVEVVKSFLAERIEAAVQAGIEESRIWIDPGIGFGKSNPEGNLELIGRIAELGDLGRPILIGPSRKSFIGHVDGSPVAERVGGTIASCLIATDGGADVLRVHDVGAVVQSLKVAAAIREASGS
jgi:dihydropteroate synthase